MHIHHWGLPTWYLCSSPWSQPAAGQNEYMEAHHGQGRLGSTPWAWKHTVGMEAHHQLSASLDMRTPKYPELQLTSKSQAKCRQNAKTPWHPTPKGPRASGVGWVWTARWRCAECGQRGGGSIRCEFASIIGFVHQLSVLLSCIDLDLADAQASDSQSRDGDEREFNMPSGLLDEQSCLSALIGFPDL